MKIGASHVRSAGFHELFFLGNVDDDNVLVCHFRDEKKNAVDN